MRALASGCCPSLRELKLDPLSVEHSDAYISLLAQVSSHHSKHMSVAELTRLARFPEMFGISG